MVNRYFYLHDRLGSVRQVVSYDNNLVLNSYTYGPFGEMIAADSAETIDNPFKFTGQYYDFEIGQYYLRARQYDPQLMRFTARDPIIGKFEEPLTLHKYLYCINDSLNCVDPSGALLDTLWATAEGAYDDAMDAGAALKSLKWAKKTILTMESVFNGVLDGWLNVVDGPQNVSDSALFNVGFIAGITEIQIAEKTHSASFGAVVSSAMTNAADTVLSGNNNGTGWRQVGDVMFSAFFAAIGKYAYEGTKYGDLKQIAFGQMAAWDKYLVKYLWGDGKK